MLRRSVLALPLLYTAAALAPPAVVAAAAADEAPDAVIRRMSEEVIGAARADAAIQPGDVRHAMALVDSKIMPRVDFGRMTAAAVGPAWRAATPPQRARLQAEFKLLLVRTYAGALAQVKGRTVAVLPVRAAPGDVDVVVRSVVQGAGDPLELGYRLARSPQWGWRIYNFNVLGIWLVDTYRGQFAPEINAHGLDGLIESLERRNAANRNGD